MSFGSIDAPTNLGDQSQFFDDFVSSLFRAGAQHNAPWRADGGGEVEALRGVRAWISLWGFQSPGARLMHFKDFDSMIESVLQVPMVRAMRSHYGA